MLELTMRVCVTCLYEALRESEQTLRSLPSLPQGSHPERGHVHFFLSSQFSQSEAWGRSPSQEPWRHRPVHPTECRLPRSGAVCQKPEKTKKPHTPGCSERKIAYISKETLKGEQAADVQKWNPLRSYVSGLWRWKSEKIMIGEFFKAMGCEDCSFIT